MDKVLIGLGAALLYAAYTDTHGKVLDNTSKTVKQPGFAGLMVIYAILFSFAQYNKKLDWIPANLSAIIALGFWANNQKTQ